MEGRRDPRNPGEGAGLRQDRAPVRDPHPRTAKQPARTQRAALHGEGVTFPELPPGIGEPPEPLPAELHPLSVEARAVPAQSP